MGSSSTGREKKVVLAYSGGLDTSVLVHWLMEEMDYDVITLTVGLGQPGDLEQVKKKALDTGAVHAEAVDAREVFAREFIIPSLWSNSLYQGKYPLATALGRPLIAKLQVEAAKKHGAVAIAHGCTGKGNDQVRLEVAAAALDPDLEIIAPMRDWKMSREDEIKYAQQREIPVTVSKESPYSIDENMWGRSCECGLLEDPWVEPPQDAYEWTVPPAEAPEKPEYAEISFEGGVPVAVNGEELQLVELIELLNKLGGERGVGRVDMVEDRLVGIKSREIYEAPAAVILIEAHLALEKLTLTREVLSFKTVVEQKAAQLAYEGLWFSPLNSAITEFNREIQKRVNGDVRVKLYKGSAVVAGSRSKNSLYDLGLATYDSSDIFDHNAAEGFIKLWGLPLQVWSKAENTVEEDG
ncbi:MAG: argininosuccinate synthase [Actinobacteria bacterium]|nr:argininosuccinate synthase [Actinomycetota bacterium]